MTMSQLLLATRRWYRLRQAASLQSSNNGSQSSAENPTAGISLSKEHQQLKDWLVKLNGNAFDREYINAVVQEHQKDIREFENEASLNSNATGAGREKPAPIGTQGQPQALARDILPTLKMHLEEATMLQRQMGGR
jgi:putative membrane protein